MILGLGVMPPLTRKGWCREQNTHTHTHTHTRTHTADSSAPMFTHPCTPPHAAITISVSLGRNEAGYNTTWIKATRSAMTDAGFGHVKVIAADDHRGGTPPLVAAMTTDRELRDAIDIIGVHTMGRINGVTVDNQSKVQMAAMHKPFWNTEQHFGIPDPNARSCREWATAAQLAITLNRLYENALTAFKQLDAFVNTALRLCEIMGTP